MKYAIIGTSWITQAFIDSANTIEDFTLGGVYSRSLAHAVEFASKNNCDYAYDDLVTLAKSGMDAVYIASPNSLHYEQAKLFLTHGKHVICEKPAAVWPEQLRALHDLAHENGLVFMEAIMMLHQPHLGAVKNSLEKLGKIETARFDFCQYSSRYQSYIDGNLPNIFNPHFATGCMMDLGVYVVYPAIYLFGRPKEIITRANFLPSGADISFSSLFIYDDKHIVLTASKAAESRIGSEILGNKGTMTIGTLFQLADIGIEYIDGKRETIIGEIPRLELMANEAKDFIRYVKRPRESARELALAQQLSLTVLETIAEMRRQAGIIFPE